MSTAAATIASLLSWIACGASTATTCTKSVDEAVSRSWYPAQSLATRPASSSAVRTTTGRSPKSVLRRARAVRSGVDQPTTLLPPDGPPVAVDELLRGRGVLQHQAGHQVPVASGEGLDHQATVGPAEQHVRRLLAVRGQGFRECIGGVARPRSRVVTAERRTVTQAGAVVRAHPVPRRQVLCQRLEGCAAGAQTGRQDDNWTLGPGALHRQLRFGSGRGRRGHSRRRRGRRRRHSGRGRGGRPGLGTAAATRDRQADDDGHGGCAHPFTLDAPTAQNAEMSTTVRTMRREEVDLAIELAAREGGQPGLHDAHCFLRGRPRRLPDGRGRWPASRAASAPCPTRAASASSACTSSCPSGAARAVGWRLWTQGMQRLAGHLVGLDGVPAQQDNYRKSGFLLAWQNMRYAGVARRVRRMRHMARPSIRAAGGHRLHHAGPRRSPRLPRPARASSCVAWISTCRMPRARLRRRRSGRVAGV